MKLHGNLPIEEMLKRSFDIFLVCLLFGVLLVPMIFIALLIKSTSKGPVLYWSDRVGRNNNIFRMVKFRSMRFDTPTVATHLLVEPDNYLTSFGTFLRKTSLDELPQFFNIIRGDMSFVGPRPALFNQNDLIVLRKLSEIDKLTPGLTGWAQVNGRDDLSIEDKVDLDFYYLRNQSFWLDIKILLLTMIKVVRREGVSH